MLCWEFARAQARAVQSAAGEAFLASSAAVAFQLSREQGYAAMGFVLPAPGRFLRRGRKQQRPNPAPPGSIADLRQALENLALVPLLEADVFNALSVCVGMAAYWQPPYGEDVLAATAELRPALLRVAESLLSNHNLRWWEESVDPANQWVVQWLEPNRTAPAEHAHHDALTTLIAWKQAIKTAEERSRDQHKGTKGLAASGDWWVLPHYMDLARTTRALPSQGPLGLRLVEDSSGWNRAEVAPALIPPGVRIHEVDGPAAWAELCRRYPLEVTYSRGTVWREATGREGGWTIPDFLALARDYEAVHVSVAGYLTTAGRVAPLGSGQATTLAGWDPDETRWLIDLETGEPQSWCFQGDDWIRS